MGILKLKKLFNKREKMYLIDKIIYCNYFKT